jgi:hypothetical protein
MKHAISSAPGRFSALASALALTIALARTASAQQDAPGSGPRGDAAAPAISYALGVSLGFLQQRALGSSTHTAFIPSLLGLAYVPIAPRVFLRPGLRLGYTGLNQADASYGARIEERGLQGSAELGISYDAWLVPAFAIGTGLDYRSINFVGRGIVADSAAIDREEWLGLAFAQAGVGVPLFHAALVAEPYARLQYTLSDDRSRWQLGLDLSFAL